jgi:endonuclease III
MIDKKAQILADYVRNLNNFTIQETIDGDYNHMGAIITDAILQAGTKYETVVRPRVKSILSLYPEVRTTSGFLQLIKKIGVKKILSWNDDEKPNRVIGATEFFIKEGVETQEDLRTWLSQEANTQKLLSLRGVGPKTADYFKILAGIQTNAIDRHLLTFLQEAGIQVSDYQEAQDIINFAADMLGVDRAIFDHSIWEYMSTGKDAGCRKSELD